MNIWRQTRLNADASLLTIHGSFAAFVDPSGFAHQVVIPVVAAAKEAAKLAPTVRQKGFKAALAESQTGRQFTTRALADDLTNRYSEWLDFSFYTGMPVQAGTPEEFATTLLTALVDRIHVPGAAGLSGFISRANEGAFVMLLRTMESQFNDMVRQGARIGMSPVDAKVAGGDVARMIIPVGNPGKLGLGAKRTALERAAATSISFLRQGITFTSEAATGYAKLLLKGPGEVLPGDALAQWARLTPTERFAVQKFTQIHGTIAGMTTISAIVTAEARGLEAEDAGILSLIPGVKQSTLSAIKRNLDPTGGDFYKLWITPDVGIPLGSTLRALMRSIAPKDTDTGLGFEIPLPFHGFVPFADTSRTLAGVIPEFFENRITPLGGAIIDWSTNKNFYQEEIHSGAGPERALDTLIFAAEQAAPLIIGAPLEAGTRGLSIPDVTVEAFGSAIGVNPQFVSESEQMERARRRSAASLLGADAPTLQLAGLTEGQALAVEGFKNIDDMRRRIGSRATNAFLEANSDEFPDTLEDYIAELERREKRNDDVAGDLLIGVRTQQDLNNLAESKITTRDGFTSIDRIGYRRDRAPRMAEQRGAISESDLDKLRGSELKVDRLTAEYWDIYDLADDGKGGIDFEVFDTLEQVFAFENPELWPIVEANALSAPRGANQLERDLRDDRKVITGAGLWQVQKDAWTAFTTITQRLADQNPQNAVLARNAELAGRVDNIRDLVDLLAAETDIALQRDSGISSRPLAEKIAAGHKLVKDYNEAASAFRIKWVLDNFQNMVTITNDQGDQEEVNVPAVALRQGYISNNEFNIIASGEFKQDEPEEERPEPQSTNLQTQGMMDDFVAGRSFGQIATAEGMQPKAVQARLRRFAQANGFENPLAMREATL